MEEYDRYFETASPPPQNLDHITKGVQSFVRKAENV